ncbi:hypothetical protein [Aquabacterium sp.]|uniref:hypothetical protein n=1 Tax=Aquabacterium sp. TaxID=1872578 RepID=UPI002BB9B6FF|nr:hypothetical protein [Aquabacterium sp.]HSW05010.1 hypothetical protein [Aquabacterium sp.]
MGAALLLALACGLLHGSALRNGWHSDDPAILNFATLYSPWQYFSSRDVMLQQSYASLTPWNALFYDIGLPWFGLNPRGHYLHMLAVLWATAFATYSLLWRRLGAGRALAAALMFIAMPPTAAISQALMTGHYAYGLLFSVLAIGSFRRAIDRNSGAWSLASAGLYAMACLCKEVYVPLPVALLLMPAGDWRQRLKLALPVLGVGMGYTVLRLWVLGGVGGYAALSASEGPQLPSGLPAAASLLRSLKLLNFGQGAPGFVALALALLVLALAWFRRRRAPANFVLVSAAALLLPVLPVLLLPDFPHGPDRLAFAMAWALAVLIAWHLQGQRWWPAVAVPLIVLLAVNQRQVNDRVSSRQTAKPAEYGFLTSADAQQVLVPHHYEMVGYLELIAQASSRLSGRGSPRIVKDEEELVALGADPGRRSWAWRDDCACLRPLGDDYDRRVQAFLRRLASGAGRRMSVTLSLDGRGRNKVFRWAVAGPPGQVYLDVRHVSRLALPRAGTLAFGVDSSVPLGNPALLRVTLETEDGALIRSPLLALPTGGSHTTSWPPMPDNPKARP